MLRGKPILENLKVEIGGRPLARPTTWSNRDFIPSSEYAVFDHWRGTGRGMKNKH